MQGVITRSAVTDQLDRIRLPTLIMVGEHDVATTQEKAGFMQEKIPNSQFILIPNAGHMTPIEAAEAVSSAINAFLSGF
jgi:3-oxoadipate enol-lactonase